MTMNLKPLQAAYVVCGNEILLHVEACDAIRAAANEQGFTERHRFEMDGRSDWTEVFEAAQSQSLFGDKCFIDISLPGGKPGTTGSKALLTLCDQLQQTRNQTERHTAYLIQLPQLDRSTRNSKWAKTLQATLQQQWINVPTINRQQLPHWLQQRAQKQQQPLSPDALQWLAEQVEGNLLAAHQELQKMALLYPSGELSLEAVQNAVLNVARYNVFDLREAVRNGQAKRALAILHGLQGEGAALPLVLWALNEAASATPAAVRHAHHIDRLIKGLDTPGLLTDAWEEMARLCLRLALRTS